jgi:hypothetical protein
MTATTMTTMTTRTDQPRQLTRAARVAGIVVWSSFLAAAFATMLCFAFIDPQALAAGDPPGWWGPRMRVYAIGFFFFWFVGLAASGLAWLLIFPTRRH